MLRLLLSLRILVVTVHSNYFCPNTHIIGTQFSSYIINSHGNSGSYVGFELINLTKDCSFIGLLLALHMPTVDIKSESINNYIAEFLKEIDSSFLNPEFNTYIAIDSI